MDEKMGFLNDDELNKMQFSSGDPEDENLEDELDDEDVEEEIPENIDLNGNEVDTEKFLAKLNEDGDTPILEKRVFQCPKCKKFYQNGKWVHDPTIGISVLKPELAYCSKCMKRVFEDEWIGRVIIHDRQLERRKDMFVAIAEQIARTRENIYDFEGILAIYEEDGLLYINTNTTSLAKSIGQRLREDFHGGIEYHWEEKNLYLTVKWFDELKNSQYYKEKLKKKKERYPGIYFFDDED
jgi:RNA polymerase subunit RPABC4/transcription elongation factor Spt4